MNASAVDMPQLSKTSRPQRDLWPAMSEQEEGKWNLGNREGRWWDGGMRRGLLKSRRLCLFKPLLSSNVHFSLSPHLHLHALLPSSSGEVSLTCPLIKDKQVECKICSWVLRERRVPLGFCVPDLNPVVSRLHSDHTQQQRSVYSAQLVTEDPGAAHLSVHLTLAPALPSASIHTDYRARDKEELTYLTGAAEQREDQRWLGWMEVYCLTLTLFMKKRSWSCSECV